MSTRGVRWMVAAGVAVAAVVGVAAPAPAMVRGTPDTARTAVGSMWASIGGGAPFFLCTGTFVSPTVFVTASHCVDFVVSTGASVRVSLADRFPPGGQAPSDLVTATPHLNPRYKEAKGTDLYLFDVSVLTVAAPPVTAAPIRFAQLPTLGLLDDLKAAGRLRSQTFTVAGYGTSSMVVDPASGSAPPLFFPDTSERQSGVLGFHALDRSVLHEDQREGAGFAGAGYGDSGGPSFLGDSNVIVGVTSTGDIPCYATNTAYRLDTPAAREFLGAFVPLP